MNLLKETKNILKDNGHSLSDIVAVQGNVFGITVENFLKIADVEYDDGFGSPKVAEDLIVIGKGFWLERHEYDGSEWWEYKEFPSIAKNIQEVHALTVNQATNNCACGWLNLDELNKESEE